MSHYNEYRILILYIIRWILIICIRNFEYLMLQNVWSVYFYRYIFTSVLYLDLSNESTNLNSRLLMCLNVSYAQRQPILYRNSCTFCCYLCVNTSFSFSNHFSLPFCVCCTAESSFLCVLSMFKLPKFSVLKHRYPTLWIFTNEIKRKKQALMFYKIFSCWLLGI